MGNGLLFSCQHCQHTIYHSNISNVAMLLKLVDKGGGADGLGGGVDGLVGGGGRWLGGGTTGFLLNLILIMNF